MRKRWICSLIVVVLALVLPSIAAACDTCKLYKICMGDDCWWTSICGSSTYPNAGWTECDDSTQPCTYAGQKCKWVFAPELQKDPDAPSSGP